MAVKVERTVKYTSYYDDGADLSVIDFGIDNPRAKANISTELAYWTTAVVNEITSVVTPDEEDPAPGSLSFAEHLGVENLEDGDLASLIDLFTSYSL